MARDSSPPTTPISILEDILKGQFELIQTQGGMVLTSTSDEGQSGSFSIPDGLDSKAIMQLADEAIRWFEQQEDPMNPDFSRDCTPRVQLGFVSCPPT